VLNFSIKATKLKEEDVLVPINPKYFRPREVDLSIGDVSKVRNYLICKPKYDLNGLVKVMVATDVNLFKKNFAINHKRL
jgi:GDPmannose 4,6-dehydratase